MAQQNAPSGLAADNSLTTLFGAWIWVYSVVGRGGGAGIRTLVGCYTETA
jgi:hypothetical protein